MLLNLDIWHEIIGYLEYPRDKWTLFSLAVTSRCLSNLALDIVWRNGERSPTLVHVINSFTSSPNEPFLEYIYESERGEGDSEDDSSSPSDDMVGGWHLTNPVPYAARKRAFGYLARIRKLKIFQHGQATKAVSLWLILSACLGCHGPLLPNLQYLEIVLSEEVDDPIRDPINHLIPLISPSLEVLHINAARLLKHKAALTILNLAHTRGCDLKEFTYDGGPIQHLPDTITFFRNLQKVQIPLYRIPRHKASVTITKFLAMLPSLHSLSCNLAAFSHSTYEYRSCHTSLQRIEIKSPAIALRELFREFVFPSVTEVKILKDGRVPGFEGLASSFPKTRKLALCVNALADRDDDQPLEFKHLASLLSLPIEVFNLEVHEHNLTPSNLRAFSESWTNLRSFQIISPTQLDALPSLTAFACHPTLSYLHLCTPLCCLLNDIPKIPDLIGSHTATQSSRSRLRNLYLLRNASGSGQSPGLTTTEKRTLVEYLLLLFPSLEKLKLLDKPPIRRPREDETLAELQEILLELRRGEGLRSVGMT